MDTQLVQAIAALTAVITNLQRQQQNEQHVQPNTTIMDPFASNQSLDLGSRAGSTAYATASVPPFVRHFKSSPITNATTYKAKFGMAKYTISATAQLIGTEFVGIPIPLTPVELERDGWSPKVIAKLALTLPTVKIPVPLML